MPTVDSILKCIQVVVYGYSVVLFKLLTAKHIHERWQQNSQETHSQFGVIVDHDACEKATLFNLGLASKTVSIFSDLEDKIIVRGVGSDIINDVLIPCLFSNILCDEETMGDLRVVEVEMMERIRLKKMLLSSWSDALKVEVISMEPLEVDSEVRKHVAGVTCHDNSNMIVMCEVRLWGLIDPTINSCKIIVVMVEKPLIMCYNFKSSCILSKDHFYVIIARLEGLFCGVVTSDLQ
ncbi:hypothetical protein L195_g052157, partial [Trifolium pratense]